MIGKIKGTGSYTPLKVLDNNDLAQMVETNDEWIQDRTGIVTRHIIQEDDVATMAYEASKNALENAGIQPEEIDLIILSTISAKRPLPCSACEVQKMLGAVNATCFDLNAACTGFLFAYNTAQAYIQAEMYHTVLVIGSEALSKLVDWKDRGTCILFGDGAGAAVLRGEEGKKFHQVSLSIGEKCEALTCEHDGFIKMDGQAIFKFAIKEVSSCILDLLEKNNMKAEEIDYFILHQANRRIVEGISKRLGVDVERFPMNLQKYGNTSSASIPILMDELNQEEKLEKGMKVVLAGFGAGLSLGASLMEW